jgi:hypothetical protein
VLSAATLIRPPVAGVVSLSGPSSLGGVDAAAAMRRLRVPVLLVVGADDHPFLEQARELHGAARVRDKQLLNSARFLGQMSCLVDHAAAAA